LFYIFIAHGAVPSTGGKIYWKMLVPIEPDRATSFKLFLTPFYHLGQTLALPRMRIAFAEPARLNRFGADRCANKIPAARSARRLSVEDIDPLGIETEQQVAHDPRSDAANPRRVRAGPPA
jgi:hypothetical protein